MGRQVSRTAIITGATGFIGSRLAAYLVGQGWHVSIVVRPSSKPATVAGVHTIVDDGSIDGLAAAFADLDADVCFHLATRFVPAHAPSEVAQLLEANIGFGTRIAEALIAASPQTRLINIGTAAQHYESRGYGPLSLYAATKQAMSDIMTYYAELTPLSVMTLTFYDTYGVGDTRTKIVQLLARATLTGQKLEMSPGRQLIDLIYVDDAVSGLLHATTFVESDRMVEYALRSGTPIPLTELVALFEQVSGRSVPVEFGAKPYRDREMLNYWNAGETLPGWSPNVA
jgi:nucleoside-diphosphate-sugar epimerase